MTDRLNGCTVIFNQDIRGDDAEWILNAIRMIKGVQAVEPVIADSMGISRIKVESDVRQKLWELANNFKFEE